MTVIQMSIDVLTNELNTSAEVQQAIKRNQQLVEPYVETIKSEFAEAKNVLIQAIAFDTGFKLMAHLQSALSISQLFVTTASATTSTGTGSNPIKAVINWISGTFIPWLQNIIKSVWAVIQTLITPKEWKIQGSIGHTVLGLGNATLEITFG